MIIFLMGVCASGKTTIGQKLAAQLGWSFFDGDDYHPDSNRLKMAKGIPLNDDDRFPWLTIIANLAKQEIESGRSAVIACSALKLIYRNILRGGPYSSSDPAESCFVYLKMDEESVRKRLRERKGHFFNAELVKSQFEALEQPRNDEKDVVIVDGTCGVADVIFEVKSRI